MPLNGDRLSSCRDRAALLSTATSNCPQGLSTGTREASRRARPVPISEARKRHVEMDVEAQKCSNERHNQSTGATRMKRKASTFGLRLPPELLEQVNELAEKTNRTRTDVITDALRAYLGIQEPQGESGNRLDLMVELLQDIASTLKHGVPQKAVKRALAPRAENRYGSTVEARRETQRPVVAEISGHYDEAEVMATIRRMREEQRDRGFRYDNKAIAQALNEAGLVQSNGRPWNNDRINTVITRRMPDLK
ncbi:hypothetical protein DNZ67_23875 [Salmonella enterica subsp. enterica serovar Typhimurium]|nr:hypothetical protein [Salmonella enterica subsp. enterica serovar Typhimurium]EBV2027699.1 hypothetical protein [Salmonella enterica subsp. enterica serovar Typhimurium]